MAKGNWKPVFLILPKRNPAGKDIWYRIGTAFENGDGSWNIDVAAIPREGKLQIRNQDNKYPDRRPHPLDPNESDPFEPLPPVMQ
jgi:hypothetical protein